LSRPVTIAGSTQATRPAAFLDRDGVINRDDGYVHHKEDFIWQDEAIAAIRWFNEQGYFVFVVTNQSGVARGYYDEKAVQDLHRWMGGELARHDAHIDAFYYCPHHPEGVVGHYSRVCNCRKPMPGMIQAALAEWPVDASGSVLIGDKESDMAAASAAGITGLLWTGGSLLEIARSVTRSRHA